MTRPSEPAEGCSPPADRLGVGRRGAAHEAPTNWSVWAQAGVITAERVDPDGQRWWNLWDLRRQVAAYLADEEDSS